MERLSAPSGYKGPQPAIKPDLVGKLAKCGHIFHLHCLVAMYNNGNKVRGCSLGGGPNPLNPRPLRCGGHVGAVVHTIDTSRNKTALGGKVLRALTPLPWCRVNFFIMPSPSVKLKTKTRGRESSEEN